MYQAYLALMDENRSPLRHLPKAQRFQIMVFLSIMWSTVFSLIIGSYAYWGELVLGHVAFAAGALITGLTFKVAEKRTHRDLYQEKDGTVKYDDIWGG